MKFSKQRTVNRVVLLDVNEITSSPYQPRRQFDPKGMKELADSISQSGLLQPITVRRREGGFYQIIAGERRWRACRMAGLVEVPVRVIEADDRRVAELALVENLQREDLNPIEEALGYKSLIEEYGLTQEEASKSVGRSRPAIANAMRLLSLSKDVLPLVEDGTLSAGHARALLPISDPAEQLKAARAVIDGGLSVRKTEQLAAKTLKKLAEEPETESKTDALMVDYIAETEDYLSRSLARKVALEQKRKGGRIILEFYDSDDREALISNLARMGRSWEEIIK